VTEVIRSRGKLFRRKGRAPTAKFPRWFTRHRWNYHCQKHTKNILYNFRVDFRDKHRFSAHGELTPRNSVFNFRVNCRHPKAIAGREENSKSSRHIHWAMGTKLLSDTKFNSDTQLHVCKWWCDKRKPLQRSRWRPRPAHFRPQCQTNTLN